MVKKEENGKGPTEMDTFIPIDGSDLKQGALIGSYKVQIAPPSSEYIETKKFDPFIERNVDSPTTDCDTLTHLLKASLGTGILAMPAAFKSAGLVNGVFGTIIVAIICTHCAYILVKSAHALYYRTKRTQMGFADTAQVACESGPHWAKKFALPLRYLIQISLFVTYFGTCSVYTVIIVKNFMQVINVYTIGVESTKAGLMCIEIQFAILILLIPMILLSWVPNLKYLAPFSMIANVLMGISLVTTMYYLVIDRPDISTIPKTSTIAEFPKFFTFTVFAMEAIGVVMPLENNMKTPQHFVGICGVLNKGMSGVTMIYILLGFLGYARYGELTDSSITLNLPLNEIPAQVVKVLIGLAVYCTFGLQFYVCLDIAWNGIKDKFAKRPLLANYILRTVLVFGAVMIAVAVPTIGPFIGLIGAFCFSILGLFLPALIETVTFWETGFGPFKWVAVKNIIITIIAALALVFGSMDALKEIVKEFGPKVSVLINATANANVTATV